MSRWPSGRGYGEEAAWYAARPASKPRVPVLHCCVCRATCTQALHPPSQERPTRLREMFWTERVARGAPYVAVAEKAASVLGEQPCIACTPA